MKRPSLSSVDRLVMGSFVAWNGPRNGPAIARIAAMSSATTTTIPHATSVYRGPARSVTIKAFTMSATPASTLRASSAIGSS